MYGRDLHGSWTGACLVAGLGQWGNRMKSKSIIQRATANAQGHSKGRERAKRQLWAELSTGKEWLGLWTKKTFAVRFLLCLLSVSGTGGDGIYLQSWFCIWCLAQLHFECFKWSIVLVFFLVKFTYYREHVILFFLLFLLYCILYF